MNKAAGISGRQLIQAELDVLSFVIPGYKSNIDLRLYRPAGHSLLPIVLYFHGGGFVGGSLDDVKEVSQYLSRHCPALVATINYSLAPAHPFPAAVEDAYASLIWLADHAEKIGGDKKRLAVAGDDAGGNLAAILPLVVRDRKAISITAQVLIGPMLDPSMIWLGNADRIHSDISEQTCLKCYSQYLPHTLQRMHPYAAPLESRRLTGLPPALIITAECDVLHIEAEKYAAALIDAGVPTQVSRLPKLKHRELPSNEKTFSDITYFLQRHFKVTADRSNPNPRRKG